MSTGGTGAFIFVPGITKAAAGAGCLTGAGLVGMRGSATLPLPLRAIRKLLENVVAVQWD